MGACAVSCIGHPALAALHRTVYAAWRVTQVPLRVQCARQPPGQRNGAMPQRGSGGGGCAGGGQVVQGLQVPSTCDTAAVITDKMEVAGCKWSHIAALSPALNLQVNAEH